MVTLRVYARSRLQTTPTPGAPIPSQKQANKDTITTIHDPVSVWSERLWEESSR